MESSNMKTLIGITGEKLGGKDVVAQYLIDKYGATKVVYSDILMEILGLLDLEQSRRNTIKLSPALRAAFGGGVLGPPMAKKIAAAPSELVVLSGMRDLGEVPWVKKLNGKILYVTAPFELRYQRFMQRREKQDDGIQSKKEFTEQEQAPTEIQIPIIGAEADFRIDNDGTLEELHKKIDEVMLKIN